MAAPRHRLTVGPWIPSGDLEVNWNIEAIYWTATCKFDCFILHCTKTGFNCALLARQMSAPRSLGAIGSAALRPRPQPQLRCLRSAAPAAITTGPTSSPVRRAFTTPTSSKNQPPQTQFQARRPRAAPATTPSPSSQSRRSYHSADHPSEDALPFGKTETAILTAAYAHVPEHGFTDRALALGARDAGLPDISTTILPGGAFALVRWHLVTRRRELEARAREFFPAAAATNASKPLTQAQVNARAEQLTWARLHANRAVIGRWQEALAIMAQPSCAPEALKELAQLADDIWFLAGDAAVDPSWYTKRAALSATYAATELFMTNDRSPDFGETREFLARRFADAAEVSGAIGSVGQWIGFTASAGVNVLRSKGVRI
ncbi:ubiquinone biosynthesis protein COQ9-B, mitochondrial precursor [Pyricularia oryzae Y34]|uniref:Ubiquinone biosynthesis protein n=1 Tax=Pyricularia oryzae (strain Y34) TaxID=1143189 RepID=A0AA97NUD2_PYRO3|nr:ubiquinone biosynthesis protein COQ9-B, mitochondrial precursor [Pyricularia oryzae Y34]